MQVRSPTEEDVLRPLWPAPANVRTRFTTRRGGCSQAPYHALNLGNHVGDDPAAVACNRGLLQQHIGLVPNYLDQVHGTDVLDLRAPLSDAARADGSATEVPGVVCTVMVADCLPVLLADRQGRWVAALHAGWRGLLGVGGVGVLEQGIRQYLRANSAESRAEIAQCASNLIAWLGPCIGPQAFEVGDEVRAAFVDGDFGAAECFAPRGAGKWLANLPALARRRLAAAGVQAFYGNDGSGPWCTVSNPDRFFSHRRDRVSGRMAACIWLDGGL